jgi:hypothetical protein
MQMSTRSTGAKYVMRLEYATLAIALFAAQSIACAVNAPPPEATQPPEATGKQSNSQAVVEGASAPSRPALMRPEQAVQVPRSAVLQGPEHVTVATHQGFTAVPSGLTGGAK